MKPRHETRAELITNRAMRLSVMRNRINAEDWPGCISVCCELMEYDLLLNHRIHAEDIIEPVAHPV